MPEEPCSTTGGSPLYDDGCPCFYMEDVAYLLSFAAESGGSCFYSEYIYSDYHEWDLSAFPGEGYSVFGLQDYSSGTDSCFSETSYTYGYEYSFAPLDGPFNGTTSDCQKLIEDVKDHIVTLGCVVSCQCGNGECTPDGCICNPGWVGTGCDTCADGLVGPTCDNVNYPDCVIDNPQWIGDAFCNAEYNTVECGYDGGDCCAPGTFGYNCNLNYPDCNVEFPQGVGDCICDYFSLSNSEECGYDGGDCCRPGTFGPYCDLNLPNCNVEIPPWVGDGVCDGFPYNTVDCGYDGGDCCSPGFVGPNCDNVDYPNCNVDFSQAVGNGFCNGLPYNTADCGYDGGDCCSPGWVGPNCDNVDYPNCNVEFPNYIGDGWCDWDLEGDYNTANCGWDGVDCCKETCVCLVYPCGVNDFVCLDPDYSD